MVKKRSEKDVDKILKKETESADKFGWNNLDQIIIIRQPKKKSKE